MFNVNEFKFIHLESITSTNDYAKELFFSEKVSNFVVIADTQTNGKTTKNSSPWQSPVGNLYMSMTIKLIPEIERFTHLLSFITALSLTEVVKDILPNANIKIKWPNDVLLNVKKLSGILIEKENDIIVIGIGVNILSSPKTNNIKYPTTSLKEAGIDIDKIKFAKLLTKKIIENLNNAIKTKFSSLIDDIKPYMYKINDTIYVDFNNEIIVGKFENLDINGGIIIKTNRETKTLLSGTLTKENFI